MALLRHSVPARLRRSFSLAGISLVFGVLAATGGAQAASATVTAPAASSAPFAEIQNYNSGLCIEAHGASTQAGLQLDQWVCRGATNELWRPYEYSAPDYQFYQENDLQCINVQGDSTANGAPIVQWPCTRGSPTPNEVWTPNLFIGNMNGLSYYEWYNPHSDKCLNVADGSKAEGAQIIQWTCIPTASNEWFALPYYGA